jgi:AcrR family transcriptional regulator
VGYVHSGETILAAAIQVVHDVGLADLTYRLVGERLDLPTRTVVYYFPTKTDLLVAVLDAVARKLRETMSDALGDELLSPEQARDRIWACLATADIDPFFRVYIELAGSAAARRQPYVELLPTIYHQWVDWLAEHLDVPAEHRHAAAAAAFAHVDGLLIVRALGARALADAAANYMTIKAS